MAAVNCWFPTSDCAKEFGNKSLATPFPVLIFYPGQQGGVQYRGPLRADLITRCHAFFSRQVYLCTSVQVGTGLQISAHTPQIRRPSGIAAGWILTPKDPDLTLKQPQVTQPSVLVAFLPLTSPTSLDPAHVPLLRTALALLEVHPDRALGVAVTTEPSLAR